MDQVLHEYGSIAFGLAALLLLWKVVVQPTLQVNRIDREAITAAARSVESAAKTIESSTATIDASVRVIHQTVGSLEKVTDNVKQVGELAARTTDRLELLVEAERAMMQKHKP